MKLICSIMTLEITKNDRKELKNMATSSFDKTFIVDNPADQKRLLYIMEAKMTEDKHVTMYTQADIDRGESLLRQYLSHCMG